VKSKWKEFSEYFRGFSSEALNDIMRATEQLASTSVLLLNRKQEAERKAILARAQEVTEKLSEVLCSEIPLVAAVALLTEVRTLERLIQQQADERRQARGEP
jgi:N-glycosylase/DNA lyase